MSQAPATWVAQAWQHWHRPWAVTHADWLDTSHRELAATDSQELTLRLHYRAWCEHYELAPTMHEFDDTTWWRLFGLPVARFDLAARRVGLALMFAAQPRLRLVRQAGDDGAALRWALERARFVPDDVAAALREAAPAEAPMHFAALSLCWCLADDATPLWARLKLRLAPDHLPAGRTALRRPEPPPCASLAALWADSARAVHLENRT